MAKKKAKKAEKKTEVPASAINFDGVATKEDLDKVTARIDRIVKAVCSAKPVTKDM